MLAVFPMTQCHGQGIKALLDIPVPNDKLSSFHTTSISQLEVSNTIKPHSCFHYDTTKYNGTTTATATANTAANTAVSF
jgi:hypothetical protein